MEEISKIIPKGKIRCFLTGIDRKETPEEIVRQSWLQKLIDEYGYSKDQLEVEYTIKSGSSKQRIDIAIFYPEKKHTQENIYIIVETKREEIKVNDRDQGIDQLQSYLSACPNSKFGMWIGFEKQAFEVAIEDGLRKCKPINDIPLFGGQNLDKFTFDLLLEPVEGLRMIFRRCHNYIYMNQGLQKEHAFREFLKIIFCKVYDENESNPDDLQFYISNDERKTNDGKVSAKKRIEEIFKSVKTKYSYIFGDNEKIDLEPRVCAYVVGELQRYSFLKADTDIKGEAYEEIVGSNLRGDKGEFFTPRNVCNLAVNMVLEMYKPDKWKTLKIFDPACGTGGFLVTALSKLKEKIFEENLKRWSGDYTEARMLTKQHIKEICNKNFFGSDFNPFLVSACQMNMVMNGDGSSNIYHLNSLLPFTDYLSKADGNIHPQIFDIVITNPPFGNDPSKGTFIDDPYILENYEIRNNRVAVPSEQLFVERCVGLLKDGGVLAIVLPDNILSNPGLEFIRKYLLKVCKVVAVVDLPTETFEPHTGVQTSVIVLKKKNKIEIELWENGVRNNYPIFMAIAEKIGHDRRGNKLFKRLATGEEILQKRTKSIKINKNGTIISEQRISEERVIDDDIPDIIDVYTKWLNGNGRWAKNEE